jgi:putative ABC transport system permease protein
MILKILKKDIRRNKVTAAVLLVFILLAALLVGSAANIVTTLFGAIDNMFAAGNPPHFVQMHSGEIDKDEVREFAEMNPLVKDWMISEAVVADSSVLYWNGGSESDAASVMENYFVEQNTDFDYLLNLKSKRIELSKGEIAVPIYYLERCNLAIGDSLTIKNNKGELSLVISDFVRDAQMNPGFISSKRFVVS